MNHVYAKEMQTSMTKIGYQRHGPKEIWVTKWHDNYEIVIKSYVIDYADIKGWLIT